jgi:hypothetical protein
MRTEMAGFLACTLCSIVATSLAGPAQQPPDDIAAQVLTPSVPSSPDADKEIAGVPRGSHPAILTWERVYELAMARARASRTGLGEPPGPADPSEKGARQGATDFARFRKEFLSGNAGADGTFLDPSADVFELLRRQSAIESAQRKAAVLNALVAVFQERIQSESAGLTRVDIDLVAASSVRASLEISAGIRQFRDRLDRLKVALGLSPHAAVVLDRSSIMAFRAVFDSLETWSKHPRRNLEELPRLIARLPALGEVMIDGREILRAIEIDPDRWEEELAVAARLALKNRGGAGKGQAAREADTKLELRGRSRIRRLFDTRQAYAKVTKMYELAVRLKNETFERVNAPAAESALSRSPLLQQHVARTCEASKLEDRLFALWTSFRAQRLALYRDLGTLPFDDWGSFYADLGVSVTGPK